MTMAPIQIRVARPTDELQQVLAFYRDALGLPVIGHFENHAGTPASCSACRRASFISSSRKQMPVVHVRPQRRQPFGDLPTG